MPTPVEWLRVVGLAAGCLALGAWIVVLKLAIDDEVARRAKGVDGLLRIQSLTNLAIYTLSAVLAAVVTAPFVVLIQLPSINATADDLHSTAILATQLGLTATGLGLLVLALVVVQCRSLLDRYQAKHGPFNRRVDDPPIPDPPPMTSVRGPI